MSRKSLSGGVMPIRRRIRFDFRVEGLRFRPTLRWAPTEGNLRRTHAYLARIKAQIEAATFCFAEAFPHYRGRRDIPIPLGARCSTPFSITSRPGRAQRSRRHHSGLPSPDPRSCLATLHRTSTFPRRPTFATAEDRRRATMEQEDLQQRDQRAFAFGDCDHPEQRDPAVSLQSARIGKKDRPVIDPCSIQDAEVLIAALHRDWGEAQGNYDELRSSLDYRHQKRLRWWRATTMPRTAFLYHNGSRGGPRQRHDQDRRIAGSSRARVPQRSSSHNCVCVSGSCAPTYPGTNNCLSPTREGPFDVCDIHTRAGSARSVGWRSAIANLMRPVTPR